MIITLTLNAATYLQVILVMALTMFIKSYFLKTVLRVLISLLDMVIKTGELYNFIRRVDECRRCTTYLAYSMKIILRQVVVFSSGMALFSISFGIQGKMTD
jgi:hypothetical protein